AAVMATGRAGASSPAWSPPVLVDHRPPFASFGSLEGVSCTSASLCVAIDIAQNVVTSTSPAGGPPAWTWSNVGGSNYVDVANYGLAASCQWPPLCVLIAGGNVLTSTNPTAGPGAWSVANIDGTGVLTSVC